MVIASAKDVIQSSREILVIGISASYRPDDPDIIPLPWRDDGNIHTGFRKPSAISIVMRDRIDSSMVTPTDKWIGKAALIELLERLSKLPP